MTEEWPKRGAEKWPKPGSDDWPKRRGLNAATRAVLSAAAVFALWLLAGGGRRSKTSRPERDADRV